MERVVKHWKRLPGPEVNIPGGVQGMTERSTQCCGLSDKGGNGHRLDLMVWEFFSYLINSGILYGWKASFSLEIFHSHGSWKVKHLIYNPRSIQQKDSSRGHKSIYLYHVSFWLFFFFFFWMEYLQNCHLEI